MKKLFFLFLLGSATLFPACTTTEIAFVTDPKTAGLPPVYITKLPDRAYQEVGYISVSGAVFATKARLVRRLREAAVKNNMDAVINVKYHYQGYWPVVEGVGVKFEGSK